MLPFLIMLNQIDYSLYSTSPEFFWYGVARVVASILGYMGAVLIFWQILLGSRFIVGLFTRNILEVNKIHQNLGKYGTLLIFAHPILVSIGFFQNINWRLTIVDYGNLTDHVVFGKFAFLILLTIYVTSAFLRGKLKFRPWSYIHYFSYPMFALVLLHVIDLGRFWNDSMYFQIFWICLAISFIAILIHRVCKFYGIGKYKLELLNSEVMAGDILVLSLKFNSDNFSHMYGQYVYLQSGRGHEAHPFSIVDYDKKSKIIKLGIKMLGKYTTQLKNAKVGSEMFLDGPYGELMLATKMKTSKIFVAGGIGITPFVEYLKKSQDNDAILLNCNRDVDNVLFHEELQKKLGDRYYDFISEMQIQPSKNLFCCRLDANVIRENFDLSMIDGSQIFICGSNAFNNSIKKVFMELGVNVKNVNIESFG